MKATRYIRLLMALCLAVIAVQAFDANALAQCSMCKTALAGSSNALFVRNFNISVLVLLIPPVTVFCSIFIVLRRSNTSNKD